MSVSQEEYERVLAGWLCAGCYGRNFIVGYDSGVTSEITVGLTKKTDIVITIEDEDEQILYTMPNSAVKRDIQKSSHYLHEFFDAHGIIFGFDTVYASYWGHYNNGQKCWGDRYDNSLGSYSQNVTAENSALYYADLRNNLIVYYHEVSSYSISASGAEMIGRDKLAYGGWYGGEDGCMRINILDAIAMPMTRTKIKESKEFITTGNFVPYSDTDSEIISKTITASDRSGYSGGVAFDTFHWGDYDVIDEDKDYDCGSGEYQVFAENEPLDRYSNSWDNYGSYYAIDNYDESTWDYAYNGGMNKINNGTYDYPSFVVIDPTPRGSWAVDIADHKFFSQKTRDNKVFSRLDGTNPEIKVEEYTEDNKNYIVFYPVAPV